MEKSIKTYDEIWSPVIEIGQSALLHQPGNGPSTVTITSPVVSYDETTEQIETQNTVYVPA